MYMYYQYAYTTACKYPYHTVREYLYKDSDDESSYEFE